MPNDGEDRTMSEDSRGPPLLVIKGSFAQYGGAERDIVRQLEAWSQVFEEVRIATLHSHPELDAEANVDHGEGHPAPEWIRGMAKALSRSRTSFGFEDHGTVEQSFGGTAVKRGNRGELRGED